MAHHIDTMTDFADMDFDGNGIYYVELVNIPKTIEKMEE